MFDWKIVLETLFALVVFISLIYLYRKNYLDEQYLDILYNFIDDMDDDYGIISLLANYAKIAVRAVEQMVAAGIIPKEDKDRKEKAEELVSEYATADGVELSDDEKQAASSLIEAEVYAMKQERK